MPPGPVVIDVDDQEIEYLGSSRPMGQGILAVDGLLRG